MQFILKIAENSGRIMKRIDQSKVSQSSDKKINPLLIAAGLILLITGLVLLAVEPIKRYNRKKIAEEALTAISENIEASESDESAMTYVVPATGNEVPGEEEEGYDLIGDDVAEIREETAPHNNGGGGGNVTLNSIGILTINKIGISYSVWDDATNVSLRYGLGHYVDSVLPGEKGNATILGHNYKDGTMFHNLGKLKKGDKVLFKDKNGKQMTFVVQESKIVKASDMTKYAPGNITDSKQLTLVTCTYEYGRKGWRRVVICKLK